MLYLFTGTDREKTRAALNAALRQAQGKRQTIRITDTNTLADLEMTLRGGGMFGELRVVVFDGVLVNEEMRPLVMTSLPVLKDSAELFFILEEKPDADTRKKIEKYSEKMERYDASGRWNVW